MLPTVRRIARLALAPALACLAACGPPEVRPPDPPTPGPPTPGPPAQVYPIDDGRNPLVCFGNSPCTQARLAHAREQLEQLVTQLEAAEARLRAAGRVRGQPTELDRAIDAVARAAYGTAQRAESLDVTLTLLRGDTAVMANQLRAYRKVIDSLLRADDVVHWVAAPRQELLGLGVVREHHVRFLPFGWGRVLVPAAEAPPDAWKSISRADSTTIDLPDKTREYVIVSPHRADLLTTGRVEGNRVKGRLHIREPLQFWKVSRYLVLEQR